MKIVRESVKETLDKLIAENFKLEHQVFDRDNRIRELEAAVARLRERGLVLFDALSHLSVAVHDWNDGTLTAQQLVDINATARKALNGSALSEERE